jgi:hypothetical protein
MVGTISPLPEFFGAELCYQRNPPALDVGAGEAKCKGKG